MESAAMIDAIFADNNYIASKKLLDATTMRHEAIAANIANIETPGYKRVDLPRNFGEEFATRFRNGDADRISLPSLARDTDAQSQRLDGNNVDLEQELLSLSSNSMQYSALTEFVSNSLKQLKVAITGQIS